MKILVAGLGIIGGSACMSLKRAGYVVDGWNRSPAPLDHAIKNGIIDRAANDFTEYDLVFVVLPPEATAAFITENEFRQGATVCDMCGIKSWLAQKINERPRSFNYIGCHPMAGKEVSGIQNACADLFDGASMIITPDPRTDERALISLRSVVKDMGFGRIVECSAEVHDRKIAYTSQLAHIVSNCYVKDPELENCLGFTGGSFQDMTRIAGVDEALWASLYLKNSENLVCRIDNLVAALQEIKNALSAGDEEQLKGVLVGGRRLYEKSKEPADKKNSDSERISIIKLR